MRLGLATHCLAVALLGQQVPDLAFKPSIGEPRYPMAQGPRVAIDAAHQNFHTADGRYQTFANLLRRDGFRVASWSDRFSSERLAAIEILVISNALHPSQSRDWAAPSASAFDAHEVAALNQWVRGGGSLMLIADHQPFPGAAAELGRSFGVEFVNAYALDGPPGRRRGRLTYRRSDGSLMSHAVTSGVESVSNFGGSAFRVEGRRRPLLKLSPDAVARVADFRGPERGYVGEPKSIGGWLQGALLERGEGRVAVFAEAAMFSAQLAGKNKAPMGMNAPHAKDNAQFLVNVIRWLAEPND